MFVLPFVDPAHFISPFTTWSRSGHKLACALASTQFTAFKCCNYVHCNIVNGTMCSRSFCRVHCSCISYPYMLPAFSLISSAEFVGGFAVRFVVIRLFAKFDFDRISCPRALRLYLEGFARVDMCAFVVTGLWTAMITQKSTQLKIQTPYLCICGVTGCMGR